MAVACACYTRYAACMCACMRAIIAFTGVSVCVCYKCLLIPICMNLLVRELVLRRINALTCALCVCRPGHLCVSSLWRQPLTDSPHILHLNDMYSARPVFGVIWFAGQNMSMNQTCLRHPAVCWWQLLWRRQRSPAVQRCPSAGRCSVAPFISNTVWGHGAPPWMSVQVSQDVKWMALCIYFYSQLVW